MTNFLDGGPNGMSTIEILNLVLLCMAIEFYFLLTVYPLKISISNGRRLLTLDGTDSCALLGPINFEPCTQVRMYIL